MTDSTTLPVCVSILARPARRPRVLACTHARHGHCVLDPAGQNRPQTNTAMESAI